MAHIKTFLGANTPQGFSSLFDELYNPYRDSKAYLIKGGPGTGKSSFMKKIYSAARELGYDTERVYCSSDNTSLDALKIEELSFCVADATAPHIIEPRFPGACENIINMGQFWNEEALFQKREQIKTLSIENSIFHRRADKFLSAAGSVIEENEKYARENILLDKIESFALRFASREFPKRNTGKPGRKMRRYISAVTPSGLVFFDETVRNLSGRVIGLEDEYGEVSALLTQRLGELAARNGYDVIFCLCPLRKGESEHIIIPQADISIVTIRSNHKISLEFDRVIHAKRFYASSQIKENKNKLSWSKKVCNELIDEAVFYLSKAKQTHDELEKCYIDTMDFEKAEIFEREFIEKNIIKGK